MRPFLGSHQNHPSCPGGTKAMTARSCETSLAKCDEATVAPSQPFRLQQVLRFAPGRLSTWLNHVESFDLMVSPQNAMFRPEPVELKTLHVQSRHTSKGMTADFSHKHFLDLSRAVCIPCSVQVSHVFFLIKSGDADERFDQVSVLFSDHINLINQGTLNLIMMILLGETTTLESGVWRYTIYVQPQITMLPILM